MKFKILLLTSFAALAMSGCRVVMAYDSHRSIRDIELGITKSEVLEILNNNYEINYKGVDERGVYVEELLFEWADSTYFIFRLEDGLLTEMRREQRPKYLEPAGYNQQ